MKRCCVVPALILMVLSVSIPTFAQVTHPKIARHGMVVATEPIAADVGVQVLKRGGNAVDAAVAVAFAMAVTYPSAGNIGGDGFMLYHGNDGQVTAFDFRLTAPAAADPWMFLTGGPDNMAMRASPSDSLPLLDSALSIGVPGTVAGMALAHERLGRLPWADLIAPAIQLAEDGFVVDDRLHREFLESRQYFLAYPETMDCLLKPNGSVYEPGDIWRQPDLAKTLKRIQKKGAAGFYEGETAQLLAEGIQRRGGLITEADMADYRAYERAPEHTTYRGYDVHAVPLPSSGGVTELEILNILEGFELKDFGHNSAAYIHLVVEAMRRSYHDRMRYLGDPEYVEDIPITKLISKAHAAALRAEIDPMKASFSDTLHVKMPDESWETTHFSVVDGEGNAVGITYSQNGDFGSYLIPKGTGVLMANTMSDFNWAPGCKNGNTGQPIGGWPNIIRPGKRPLSSQTPTIVAKDGKPVYIIGSPGGPTIIATNVQIILNVVDFEMNLAEAVAALRVFHGWQPDEIWMHERTTSRESVEKLRSMGHKVELFDRTFGPAMCIEIDRDNRVFLGAADPRSSKGVAVGY